MSKCEKRRSVATAHGFLRNEMDRRTAQSPPRRWGQKTDTKFVDTNRTLSIGLKPSVFLKSVANIKENGIKKTIS